MNQFGALGQTVVDNLLLSQDGPRSVYALQHDARAVTARLVSGAMT
jgi:hypothetical protein